MNNIKMPTSLLLRRQRGVVKKPRRSLRLGCNRHNTLSSKGKKLKHVKKLHA